MIVDMLIISFLLLVFTVVFCNAYIIIRTNGRISSDIHELPPYDTALVLGTSPLRKNGEPNPYYVNRLEMAYLLWKERKVQKILVSGTGREIRRMHEYLVGKGIPSASILCDSLGIKTYNSVVNAAAMNVGSILIVSQRFHVQRAIFFADRIGLPCHGMAAKSVVNNKTILVLAREVLAKVKAFK